VAATFVDFRAAAQIAAPFRVSMGDGLYATGRTISEFCVYYTTVVSDVDCRVDSVTVVVSIGVTLPSWRIPVQVGDLDLLNYRKYLAALALHEEGHVRIAQSFGAKLRSALETVAAPTCSEVLARAHGRVLSARQQVARAYVVYDELTRHGRQQHVVDIDSLPKTLLGSD